MLGGVDGWRSGREGVWEVDWWVVGDSRENDWESDKIFSVKGYLRSQGTSMDP